MYLAVIESADAEIVYHIWYTFRTYFTETYSAVEIKVMLAF